MPGYSLSWFTVGKLATWDNTNNMAPSDKEVNRIKFDFFSSSVLFLDNKFNKKLNFRHSQEIRTKKNLRKEKREMKRIWGNIEKNIEK